MIRITLLLTTGCALNLVLAQESALPFRQYANQQHPGIEASSKTKTSLENIRFRRYPQRVIINGEQPHHHLQDVNEEEGDIRTVVVTPKPKYIPQRLIPEPSVDPNSEWIPSIGYDPPSKAYRNYRIRAKPSEPPVAANTLTESTDSTEDATETSNIKATVVENIPALSVSIPIESGIVSPQKDGELIDYLVPPKFQSVYENHGKILIDSPESVQTRLKVPSTSNPATPKTKKYKIKRKRLPKNPLRDAEKSSAGNSEKKTRHRFRPARIRPKSTEVPTLEEPSSASTNSFPADFNAFNAAPVQQEASEAVGLSAFPGERVEFQMHGQNGPDSYKFGFDTGDGKNRHFRYEEKDQDGNVKGHYGYYDKAGKLKVVNYHADENGFHASAV